MGSGACPARLAKCCTKMPYKTCAGDACASPQLQVQECAHAPLLDCWRKSQGDVVLSLQCKTPSDTQNSSRLGSDHLHTYH